MVRKDISLLKTVSQKFSASFVIAKHHRIDVQTKKIYSGILNPKVVVGF